MAWNAGINRGALCAGFSVYSLVNHAVTTMGARLLKSWLRRPLTNLTVRDSPPRPGGLFALIPSPPLLHSNCALVTTLWKSSLLCDGTLLNCSRRCSTT